MVIHGTRSEGGLRLRGSHLGHPNCHANCAPYLEADPEFQIVGQSRNRTHSQPKGNLSERYEFRRVDNSIWRQLQEVLRTIQDVREYLTRPLASSDRSRCC
jgi:hypothetical protein